MYFNTILENKIIAKISEFTVVNSLALWLDLDLALDLYWYN